MLHFISLPNESFTRQNAGSIAMHSSGRACGGAGYNLHFTSQAAAELMGWSHGLWCGEAARGEEEGTPPLPTEALVLLTQPQPAPDE